MGNLWCFDVIFLFRYFNEFLLAHHRQVAREVRDEYVDTMGKIYFSYFKSYIAKLLKLQVLMCPACQLLSSACFNLWICCHFRTLPPPKARNVSCNSLFTAFYFSLLLSTPVDKIQYQLVCWHRARRVLNTESSIPLLLERLLDPKFTKTAQRQREPAVRLSN